MHYETYLYLKLKCIYKIKEIYVYNKLNKIKSLGRKLIYRNTNQNLFVALVLL